MLDVLQNTGQKTIKTQTLHIQTKHNPEKANNTKYCRKKLAWSSRL